MEVVLVDDAGDDGTAEAAAQLYPRLRVLRLERQAGFTRAANAGLAAATGDVLLLLNSDTEVGADGAGLAALLRRLTTDPGLGIVGAALRYPDGSPQWSGGAEPDAAWLFALASGLPALLGRLPLYRRLRPPSASLAPGAAGAGTNDGGDGSAGGAGLLAVDWVTGAALAIRRTAWEQLGPLDERFRFYAQDLDLCVRARDAGWSVGVLGDFRVLHHHGATILAEGGRRVRQEGGAQHAELLWTDLVRWAGKRGGERGARRAARALRIGGALRLLGRRLRGLSGASVERAMAALRRETW